MKAWEVVAIARDGELVCRDCCDDAERRAWEDKEPGNPDITVVFASDEGWQNDCCGRCGNKLGK